jgi:hypothetical protein
MGVAYRSHQPQSAIAEHRAAGVIEIRRRGALHYFLVATLHCAIAFMEMHEIAVHVAQYLHLDVARIAHQLLHIHFVVAECRQRFAPGGGKRGFEIVLALQNPHPSAAPAPTRLEHQRVTDSGSEAHALLQIPGQWRGCRHHRHTGCDGRVAGRHLVAKHAHDLRRRADPANAGIDDRLREIGVLREKAVTRVDCVDLRLPRDTQDVVDVEIGGERLFAFADQIAFVRLEAVESKAVLLRIDGDRADVHLRGGTHDADGDFRAIGYQQGSDRRIVHYL